MSLFIGNISPSTSKKALISYFGKFGQCEVEYYRRFAYINYLKESDGKNALNACNNQELDGSKLKVEFSQRKPVNQSPPSDKEPGVDQYRVKISSYKEGPETELQRPETDPLILIGKTPPNTPVDQAVQGSNEGVQEEVFEKIPGKVYLMRDLVGEIKPKNEKGYSEEVIEVQSDKGQFEGVDEIEQFVSGEIILTVSIDEPGKFEEVKMEIEEEKSEKNEVKIEEIVENKVKCEERVDIREKKIYIDMKPKVEVQDVEIKQKVKEANLGITNKEKNEDIEIKTKEKEEDKDYGSRLGTDSVEKVKKGESKESSKNSSPVSKLSQIKPIIPFDDPLVVQTPKPEKRRPSLLMSSSKISPGQSKSENKDNPKVESVIQVLPVGGRAEKNPRKIQKVGEGLGKKVKTKEDKKSLTIKKKENELKVEETKEKTEQTTKETKKKVSSSKVTKKIQETKAIVEENTPKGVKKIEDLKSVLEKIKNPQEPKEKLPEPEEKKIQPTQRPTRSSSKAVPQPDKAKPEISQIKETPLKQTSQPSIDPPSSNIPTPKSSKKKNSAPPAQSKNSSNLPLHALKFDYEPLDDITISIHKTVFEVKKQLKDFSNSLLKCKVCNKEIKAKSAESHLQSKFHKDFS